MDHPCHFSRDLIVTQSEAYKYYSEIEKYVERYPSYYQNIEVIDRQENSLTAKIFLNVNLSMKMDHVVVTVRYTFIPEKEIKYEVIDGPGHGIIKNSIFLSGQDSVGDKQVYKSTVEINHVPLDLMCYLPPYFNMPDNEKYKHYAFSPHGERYNEYERMLTYFTEQDLVPLERKNWGGFKIGDLCNKCKKGHLQMTGEREDTGTTKTHFLRCDNDDCAAEFRNYRMDASNTVYVK